MITKNLRRAIVRLRKRGLGYMSIQKKLGLSSTTIVRLVVLPKYREEQNKKTLARYYKKKAEGVCPNCGKKR